ncbi:MAG: ATP-dependent zinc metalloprotease FtsH [Chroococcidiopsis sp. SAG 2025]|uniref:ATP-binding protein n=1 Tax=Chroococcidiopsis sp. SAG 2025 TaxID=171389 RepID=UPI0029374005|nr:ATP-binding protein [Chroococcidiopsis sp. SAG 2025]MDV2992490.1 ATP-dependent zinc metalloprotease FtsH [Chroococcidiopsis sp. SAG 2025]
MQSNIFHALEEHIINNSPLVACESPFQERLRFFLGAAQICHKLGKNCYLWNLGESAVKKISISVEGNLATQNFDGYQPIITGQKREEYANVFYFWQTQLENGILVVENIYPWLQSENVAKHTDFLLMSEWLKSSLLNLKLYNDRARKTLVLLGDSASLSKDIVGEIPTISHELPEIDEIISVLRHSQFFPVSLEKKDWSEIARAGIGLYASDIIRGLASLNKEFNLELTASTREQIVKQATKQLLEYKIDLLNKLYNVEFVPPPKVKLGGLELMQEAFQKFKVLLSPAARQYNLKVPKGVMFVGPPGTGKSHAAKVCAQIMGVPLVLVDWGNFRSEGDRAEVKLQKLLKLADRLNQIVVYFDDLDKGFAGDDDLSRRLAGQLLTWMQERTSDVVVIASVNRMEWLPPELTRAGRFDYIYKVDLPNNGERHAIFKLHAARFDCRFRNGGDPFTEAEWRRLLKATNRCVGAEIQTIVERAAATTFYEMLASGEINQNCQPQLELTVEALLSERKQMNPLAIREADRVESMRNKADIQGLPSSPTDDSIYANGNVEIFR